jgi:hypothetical protein
MCGGCSRMVDVGDPIAWMSTPGQTWRMLRCEACEGPAQELEPLPVRAPVEERPAMTSARVLAFDWKERASGREPGQEG